MIQKTKQLFLFDEENESKIDTVKSKPIKKVLIDKVSPPIRYPGSKFRASKYILPHMQVSHNEYREPFMGSGAIFFTKQKSVINILNDLDNELITTYKIIQDSILKDELIKMLDGINPTKELFNEVKNSNAITDLEIAFKYFFINRTCYSGIMKMPNWGFHPIKSVQPNKWAEKINSAHEKLKGVAFESNHFSEIIKKPSNNNVLLFVDPPYFLADQKRAYKHYFNYDDHIDLLKSLKNTKFKFCLTYDNCNEVKELYDWANIHEYNWMYHTANSNATTRKIGKELIITNY